ncbi:MAG: hypothetical protein KA715_05950 [Xanthomonadaceae bacterium]|nr:hypothetical protein [Xanthomonadaceae bacterium]
MIRIKQFISVLFLSTLMACGSTVSDTTEETGQQVGDAMASIDEGGGSTSGTFAYQQNIESAKRTFARLSPADIEPTLLDKLVGSVYPIQSAHAGLCSLESTFSSCASNVMTRTFSGCTIGAATVTGTVALNFTDAAVDNTCSLASVGHAVARTPAFVITGRRGATLTVSKAGTNGQVLTKGSGSTFTFSNDGIRRAFSGAATFDFTTQTTSSITVTGTSRSGRVMTGGNLRVTNNTTSVTCDFVPTNVTWVATCNCATSGSWAGTCSDGKTSSLSITGCGTATVTLGTSSTSVTFDRCFSS